ncbi:MAG: helix-turn-helix transcriptional regulator [Methylococcus sp.]
MNDASPPLARPSNRHEPKDAILRHWVMLQLIPREPGGISAQQLREKLAAIDPLYDVHKRTIERNLMQLMSVFPSLDYDDRQAGGNRWFWQKDTVMDVPRLDAKTALMFRLAEIFLTPMFPPATLDELRPHFRQADKALQEIDERGYARWPDKIKLIQNSQRLLQPDLQPAILEVVYAALFEERRFRMRYQVRSGERREYEVSPRGLVFRDGIVYAVCTLSDRPDIRQLPLHRMLTAELLEAPIAPLPGFNLDHYVRDYFDYPLRFLKANAEVRDSIPATLRLEITLNAVNAVHLQEAPLSADQTTAIQPDGRVRFTASVANTERLRWWILSYGERIEVNGPPDLREEMAERVRRMGAIYALPDAS